MCCPWPRSHVGVRLMSELLMCLQQCVMCLSSVRNFPVLLCLEWLMSNR